jgi:hypothetical protein
VSDASRPSPLQRGHAGAADRAKSEAGVWQVRRVIETRTKHCIFSLMATEVQVRRPVGAAPPRRVARLLHAAPPFARHLFLPLASHLIPRFLPVSSRVIVAYKRHISAEWTSPQPPASLSPLQNMPRRMHTTYARSAKPVVSSTSSTSTVIYTTTTGGFRC